MKAAVWYGTRDIRIEQVKKPEIGGNEVLVRVRACGICGTDLHIYTGEVIYAKPPVILGHEFSGEVAETGPDVTNLRIGDRVAINPNRECRECGYCRKGFPCFCLNLKPYGVIEDGGFAEYCRVYSDAAYKVPKAVSFEEAAFSEPVSCAVHCIKEADIKPGTSVAVLGSGPMGIILAQLARASGAKPVIIADTRKDRLEKAEGLGADVTINAKEEDPVKRIHEITGETGVDLCIEAVGKGETVRQAIECVGKTGRVIIFGVPPEDVKIEVSPSDILRKELTIKGSWLNPHTFEEAIKLIHLKTVEVKPLISHMLSLEEIEKGLRVMEEKPKGMTKVIIWP